MKLSSLFSWTLRDFIQGLIMTVGGAAYAVIQKSIEDGSFTFDWAYIGKVALGAFIVYMGKKFLTPTPTLIQIDPSVTSIVDKDTKEIIVNAK